ncbi:MAG: flagellar type III secretion system pore protein FliP [Phycisphaerales bacterium JB039]
MRALRWLLAALLVAGPLCAGASAQPVMGPPVDPASASAAISAPGAPELTLNPVSVLDSAAKALPQAGGDGPAGLSAAVNILVLLTVIALVPSIMLMCTCFVRIICVLGLLRQALGTQSLPPPQAILGLSLFLTLLVMTPTIDRIYDEAVVPYRTGEITDHEELWNRAKQPLRDFMFGQIEATGNWSSLYMVLNYRGVDTSEPESITRADVDMVSLVPAFLLSELKVAFVMGFRLYLPFLVIDIVIASLLISMSMMMLPPVLISLPFKLLLFVLVDGWQLVVGSLLESFVTGPVVEPVAMIAPVVEQALLSVGVMR